VSLSSDLVVRDPSPSPVRRGQFAALDPSGRLVAVTDSLGRVVVVDALARHVIRLFKGYRAAQVRAAGLAMCCVCVHLGWVLGGQGGRPQPSWVSA
jgi:hypothetical protein